MSWPPTFVDPNLNHMPFPIPCFYTDSSGVEKNATVLLTATQLSTLTPLSTISLSSGSLTTLTPFNPLAGVQSVSIAAGTVANTVIKPSSGVLFGVCVNSVGLGIPQFFDNASLASGKVLGSLLASAPIGLAGIVPGVGAQFANGLVVSGGLTNPAITVFFL